MKQYGAWVPYSGTGAIILAVVLFVIAGALALAAFRMHRPLAFTSPGGLVGGMLVATWLLAAVTFLVGATLYGMALYQQVGRITPPADPIFPVTFACGVFAFAVILVPAMRGGFWTALGSAVIAAIAATMIFELPFDLIVMWRTFPPNPQTDYTLIYFLPLFIVEITSIALLAWSPLLRLSRYSLLALAAMFLVFGVWALFGYAYPETPIPITLNIISKILAFATVIALFLPQATQHAATATPATMHVSSETSGML